ncbi:NAD(P)/FAD-dependent oxidoreductase [Changpingibacter yushuensis]|uniref:NAD(P)/FAD-dependent oxidoreductase n=1 Tax=Changpingibacter yushuensis TaxID=2758440 RepID=UPI00165D56DB|nr:FAD-binding oxidoreductase [Changpingibacter yushuensis]
MTTNRYADVVIIGAGIVGAATAFFTAQAGLSVAVFDSRRAAGGTSSHGEGNILVSDKEPGPELDLALYSNAVWHEDLGEYSHLWEFEPKGGVVTASSETGLAALRDFAGTQRSHGIAVEMIDSPAALATFEPLINPEIPGGAFYPQDAQVQPILATNHLCRLARELGATFHFGQPVTALVRSGEKVTGVRTDDGVFSAGAVINCCGPWSCEIAALADLQLPVAPRKGYVLVTEPVGPLVSHKVYGADYVANVGSGDAALQASAVVESTPSGTILIGSSRERVGFDETFSPLAMKTIARNAVALFPFLSGINIMRTYWGFRPYCPDHLPVIGPDPRAPGLWHASGHEGAGIGLSVGTGKLLAQALTGRATDLDLSPLRPDRFEPTKESL